MTQLSRFYTEILSRLPFSIRGYHGVERIIAQFFDRLSRDGLLHANPNIQFLSYSFVTLRDIETWATRSLDRFYFYSRSERYSDLLVSQYMYMRARIHEYRNDASALSGSNAHHIAALFARDCGFRVCCTSNEEWHFGFEHDKNVLSFKLPFGRIFKAENETLRELLATYLRDASHVALMDRTALLFVDRDNNGTLYRDRNLDCNSFHDEPLGPVHRAFFDSAIDLSQLNSLTAELLHAVKYFRHTNAGFLLEDAEEKSIEAWLAQLAPIAFMGYCHEAWVEYMPATCGVFGEKRPIYRNLGSLITAYDVGSELTADERVIFKLASERVSSILAADMMRPVRREPSGKYWTETQPISKTRRTLPAESYRDSYNALRALPEEYEKVMGEVERRSNLCWNELYAPLVGRGVFPNKSFKDATGIKPGTGNLNLEGFLIYRRIYIALWFARQNANRSYLVLSYEYTDEEGDTVKKKNPSWDIACWYYALQPSEYAIYRNRSTREDSAALRQAAAIDGNDLIDGNGILPEEEDWLYDLKLYPNY